MITREQATILANLARTVRPSWDAGATINVLGQVKDRGDVAEIAYATLKAATEPDNTAPTSITFDGPHWPPRPAKQGTPTNDEPRCDYCNEPMTRCLKINSKPVRDRHDFQPKTGRAAVVTPFFPDEDDKSTSR